MEIGSPSLNRFCQRLTPVSVVCRATLQDITKHATPLLQPHFHATIDPDPVQVNSPFEKNHVLIVHLLFSQFSVHYKSRNNDTLKRDQVIKLLASLVTDEGAYPHTVCLDNPQLVVCANIIRVRMCVCNQSHTLYSDMLFYMHTLSCVCVSHRVCVV